MFTNRRLAVALERETAINVELRTRLARAEANFDWLAQHVNELKLERAALFDRMLGFQLAGVPVIQRTENLPLPGADPSYQPTVTKHPAIGDIMAKARELTDAAKRGAPAETSLATPAPDEISFNDMGDEAAAAAGIRHAPDGSAIYAR
jgi:hypothetical protein